MGFQAREAQPGTGRPDSEHAVPLTSAEGEYSAERPVGARVPFGLPPLMDLYEVPQRRLSPPAAPHTSVRSPAATSMSSVFPGGGKGQTKWSAKAHGGSSARLKSTVVSPSASGAAGYRNRKR